MTDPDRVIHPAVREDGEVSMRSDPPEVVLDGVNEGERDNVIKHFDGLGNSDDGFTVSVDGTLVFIESTNLCGTFEGNDFLGER